MVNKFTQVDVEGDTEDKVVKFESTGQIFDRYLLSPRTMEMCKDSKVVWMAEKRGKNSL